MFNPDNPWITATYDGTKVRLHGFDPDYHQHGGVWVGIGESVETKRHEIHKNDDGFFIFVDGNENNDVDITKYLMSLR
jgi:hypothetical protein